MHGVPGFTILDPKIYTMPGALRESRNSWESQGKADSTGTGDLLRPGDETFRIGPQDRLLALRLLKAGRDHAKFMHQILVAMTIIASAYWWAEAGMYKVGTVRNSTSKLARYGRCEVRQLVIAQQRAATMRNLMFRKEITHPYPEGSDAALAFTLWIEARYTMMARMQRIMESFAEFRTWFPFVSFAAFLRVIGGKRRCIGRGRSTLDDWI